MLLSSGISISITSAELSEVTPSLIERNDAWVGFCFIKASASDWAKLVGLTVTENDPIEVSSIFGTLFT